MDQELAQGGEKISTKWFSKFSAPSQSHWSQLPQGFTSNLLFDYLQTGSSSRRCWPCSPRCLNKHSCRTFLRRERQENASGNNYLPSSGDKYLTSSGNKYPPSFHPPNFYGQIDGSQTCLVLRRNFLPFLKYLEICDPSLTSYTGLIQDDKSGDKIIQ